MYIYACGLTIFNYIVRRLLDTTEWEVEGKPQAKPNHRSNQT